MAVHGESAVRVYAVWQPMMATDVTAPATSALARIPDRRARQYWDPNHFVAKQMSADARSPQPVQDCCVKNGILWDLAAVYPPGAVWDGRLPPAVVFNGPVVDITDALTRALASFRKPSA